MRRFLFVALSFAASCGIIRPAFAAPTLQVSTQPIRIMGTSSTWTTSSEVRLSLTPVGSGWGIVVGGTSTVAGTVTANQGTAGSEFWRVSTTTVYQGGAPWSMTVVGGIVDSRQYGTWTVQPGNTANTTAWLVQTVGGSVTVMQGGAPWTFSAVGGIIDSRQYGAWTITQGAAGAEHWRISTTTVFQGSAPWSFTAIGGLVDARQYGNWTVSPVGTGLFGSGTSYTVNYGGETPVVSVSAITGAPAYTPSTIMNDGRGMAVMGGVNAASATARHLILFPSSSSLWDAATNSNASSVDLGWLDAAARMFGYDANSNSWYRLRAAGGYLQMTGTAMMAGDVNTGGLAANVSTTPFSGLGNAWLGANAMIANANNAATLQAMARGLVTSTTMSEAGTDPGQYLHVKPAGIHRFGSALLTTGGLGNLIVGVETDASQNVRHTSMVSPDTDPVPVRALGSARAFVTAGVQLLQVTGNQTAGVANFARQSGTPITGSAGTRHGFGAYVLPIGSGTSTTEYPITVSAATGATRTFDAGFDKVTMRVGLEVGATNYVTASSRDMQAAANKDGVQADNSAEVPLLENWAGGARTFYFATVSDGSIEIKIRGVRRP